jgi:hypothetical protein
MSTTATIKGKGCNATGITEDLAKLCHDRLGRKVLAVVELQADSRTENTNGDESVTLKILTVEPAPNAQTEDHLRELARSFYYERQLAEGQAPTLNLDGSPEPDVETVLAAGAKHRPHPYLSSTLSVDDNAICDVCGQHEGAAVHGDMSQLDTADEQPDDADQDEAEDEVAADIDEAYDQPDDEDQNEDPEPVGSGIFDPFA